jgi:rare lipoprotein A
MSIMSASNAPQCGALKSKLIPLVLLAALIASCSSQRTPQQTGVGAYKPQVGVASWYGPGLHGNQTASGEIFDQDQLSAAHRSWPMPSLAEVTNLKNGRKVVVRVNDRGPFAKDRLIDLSRAAARALGFEQDGEAKVAVRYIGPAPEANTKAASR